MESGLHIPWSTVVIAKYLGQVLTPETAKAMALEMADASDTPIDIDCFAAQDCVKESSLPAWEPMTRPALDELLCGDADAVNFYRCVAHCTHTYDDLIDNDKPVSQADLHAFVWRLLFEIPLNPFFDKHQNVLRPLLMTGILNWIAANEMEQSGSREELRVAHVIRYSAGDILLASMTLTGGIEHARTHARRARLMLQDETWLHYSTEKQDTSP